MLDLQHLNDRAARMLLNEHARRRFILTDVENLDDKEILSRLFKEIQKYTDEKPGFVVSGILDVVQKPGSNMFGILRSMDNSFVPSFKDAFVNGSQIKQYNLRQGDSVTVLAVPTDDGKSERMMKSERILQINRRSVLGPDGKLNPHINVRRQRFKDLNTQFPSSRIVLERRDDPEAATGRIIDIFAPIGFGQRALIAAPPKVGKTTILKEIVKSIEANHPEAVLFALLIDERPEEVAEMEATMKTGYVMSSTFDQGVEDHRRVAELTIERAKRLAEAGVDVIVVFDSITRIVQAFSNSQGNGERTMSGGIVPSAMNFAKEIFGSGRCFAVPDSLRGRPGFDRKTNGSLTMIGTVLIGMESRMEELIFQGFKGRGNTEIMLDRNLAERGVYPAINLITSETREYRRLYDDETCQRIGRLREIISHAMSEKGGHTSRSGLSPIDISRKMINGIKAAPSNAVFLASPQQYINEGPHRG